MEAQTYIRAAGKAPPAIVHKTNKQKYPRYAGKATANQPTVPGTKVSEILEHKSMKICVAPP
jgi:hypothetical protein